MTVKADDLAFLGHDLKPVLEPGALRLEVGTMADRSALLTAEIQIRAGR